MLLYDGWLGWHFKDGAVAYHPSFSICLDPSRVLLWCFSTKCFKSYVKDEVRPHLVSIRRKSPSAQSQAVRLFYDLLHPPRHSSPDHGGKRALTRDVAESAEAPPSSFFE